MAGLTAWQLRLLAEVASGLTTREIAAKHVRSPETIKTLLEHAQLALGARNRPHAVAIAFRRGLLK